MCIVVQGHKIGCLGGQTFRYDPILYLVISVTLPLEYETVANPEEPLRGLYIDIDPGCGHLPRANWATDALMSLVESVLRYPPLVKKIENFWLTTPTG